MGKGDKKSKRGKITIGSWGVSRRRKSKRSPVKAGIAKIKAPKAEVREEVKKAPKKAPAKKPKKEKTTEE